MKAVVTALLLASCAPANAQGLQCASHEAVAEGLAERWGERRVMSGVISEQQFFEVYANLSTGTWTAITVQADGMACLRTSGENFDATVDELPGNL